MSYRLIINCQQLLLVIALQMTEPPCFVDDHSRVKVEPAGGVKYINANYINVSMVEQVYVIAITILLSHDTKCVQRPTTKQIAYSPIRF